MPNYQPFLSGAEDSFSALPSLLKTTQFARGEVLIIR
jgi:hypothetical protein